MSKIFGTKIPGTRTWTPGGSGSANFTVDPQGFLSLSKDSAVNAFEITTYATADGSVGNTNSVLVSVQTVSFTTSSTTEVRSGFGTYIKDISGRYACMETAVEGVGRFEQIGRYRLASSSATPASKSTDYVTFAYPSIWLRMRWREINASTFTFGVDVGLSPATMFSCFNSDLNLRDGAVFEDVDEVGIFLSGSNVNFSAVLANLWHFDFTGLQVAS